MEISHGTGDLLEETGGTAGDITWSRGTYLSGLKELLEILPGEGGPT